MCVWRIRARQDLHPADGFRGSRWRMVFDLVPDRDDVGFGMPSHGNMMLLESHR